MKIEFGLNLKRKTGNEIVSNHVKKTALIMEEKKEKKKTLEKCCITSLSEEYPSKFQDFCCLPEYTRSLRLEEAEGGLELSGRSLVKEPPLKKNTSVKIHAGHSEKNYTTILLYRNLKISPTGQDKVKAEVLRRSK